MGQQIIKQPNGKYCLFSSVIDNITHYDMTPDEIVEVRVEQFKKELQVKVGDIIDQLERDEKPYHQFTMSFGDVIETIKEVHGEAEKMETLKIMGINCDTDVAVNKASIDNSIQTAINCNL